MATATATAMTSSQIAKLIDHSLLHPTMTDKEILAGLEVAKKYKVAAACIKPYCIQMAKDILNGSGVLICAVIGFPHGNSTTTIKVLEAEEAVKAGAQEIDMVVNVGKVLGGDLEYVTNEIRAINEAVVKHGAALKVIFENDYLEDDHIIRLCKICTSLSVAFVKTSTGYGFVKQPNGLYSYKGATLPHLELMKANVGPTVQIKAAGGVRTLSEVLAIASLGVARIGASATTAIMEEAISRET
ncbi:deoxyribose-phosphate aldolase [Annulohypoxylon maeteangense]|uniref:deoxyribose-phosphate aldolase n=1 Tax=Annulohypoxylon maeteangense TaxID=1927788 RepID=UPI00200876BF|nr:deoxyribose-phosphate aldolase [Annulohypoxylon maeteangense]KAI0887072.1 deoxyribose-phosphate aldolase [Annulohypoxylon maeteangense]